MFESFAEKMTKTPGKIAYVIPWEKYIYTLNGEWNLEEPVKKDGAIQYIINQGFDPATAKAIINASEFPKVMGVGMYPNQPTVATVGEANYVNVWRPPALAPSPAPFPRIEAIARWVCAGRERDINWLIHWTARKIQRPAAPSKTAVMLLGNYGSGKSSWGRIMREMLGTRNCSVVERGAIESQFNSSWITKLFVQAEEIVTSDNSKDVSEKLKIYITSEELELEAKGRDRRKIRNALTWLICSNNGVSPIPIYAGDRRYAVFSNHSAITPEHRGLLASCFTDTNDFTPDFALEVSGFFDYLLKLEVDSELLSTLPGNAARDSLIEASSSAHDLFFEELRTEGFDSVAHEYSTTYGFDVDASQWDFGAEGVAVKKIYAVYREYCRRHGYTRPLALGKFSVALGNKGWARVQHSVGKGAARHRPWCYVVPRSVDPAE